VCVCVCVYVCEWRRRTISLEVVGERVE
jgi:hypothetical protein